MVATIGAIATQGATHGRDGNRDTGRDSARDAGRENGRENGRDRDNGRDGGRDGGRDAGRDGARDGNRSRNPRQARDDNDDEDTGSEERVTAVRRPRGGDADAERNDDRPQRGQRGPRDSERVASRDSAPQEASAADGLAEEEATAPRRRGRPRKEKPTDEGSTAIAADVLPPSLGFAANDADAAPKPRRRRITRASEDVPSAAE